MPHSRIQPSPCSSTLCARETGLLGTTPDGPATQPGEVHKGEPAEKWPTDKWPIFGVCTGPSDIANGLILSVSAGSLATGKPLCHEMRGTGGQAGTCSNRHRPAWSSAWSSARDSVLRQGRAKRETMALARWSDADAEQWALAAQRAAGGAACSLQSAVCRNRVSIRRKPVDKTRRENQGPGDCVCPCLRRDQRPTEMNGKTRASGFERGEGGAKDGHTFHPTTTHPMASIRASGYWRLKATRPEPLLGLKRAASRFQMPTPDSRRRNGTGALVAAPRRSDGWTGGGGVGKGGPKAARTISIPFGFGCPGGHGVVEGDIGRGKELWKDCRSSDGGIQKSFLLGTCGSAGLCGNYLLRRLSRHASGGCCSSYQLLQLAIILPSSTSHTPTHHPTLFHAPSPPASPSMTAAFFASHKCRPGLGKQPWILDPCVGQEDSRAATR